MVLMLHVIMLNKLYFSDIKAYNNKKEIWIIEEIKQFFKN